MRQEQETALFRKAREGETAAFGEIIRRYQNHVFAAAFQIMRDRALAEEVTKVK